jgi:hypothetical protein
MQSLLEDWHFLMPRCYAAPGSEEALDAGEAVGGRYFPVTRPAAASGAANPHAPPLSEQMATRKQPPLSPNLTARIAAAANFRPRKLDWDRITWENFPRDGKLRTL